MAHLSWHTFHVTPFMPHLLWHTFYVTPFMTLLSWHTFHVIPFMSHLLGHTFHGTPFMARPVKNNQNDHIVNLIANCTIFLAGQQLLHMMRKTNREISKLES